MRFMKKRGRQALGLGALVAAVVILSGISGGRTPDARAQVLPLCQQEDAFWNVCVVKVADPSTDEVFGFEQNVKFEGGGAVSDFVLEDLGNKNIALTESSTGITIREKNLPPGWELVDIQCTVSESATVIQEVNIEAQRVEIDFVSGPGFIYCVFYNEIEDEPEPTPPVTRRPPNIGGGLSGLFGSGPAPASATPVPPAAVAPSAVISPPRTGDAGLK